VLRHLLRQVTYTQFASVMATLGFVLSDEQRELLCKAFSVEGSSGFNELPRAPQADRPGRVMRSSDDDNDEDSPPCLALPSVAEAGSAAR
jgi:hypothetical protein